MITKQEMLSCLKNDVVPSLGCTEPVCAALSAATAADAVKGKVIEITAEVSPNIYKNGMSVGIPGFERVGLDYAVALGALLHNPERQLQLFRDITPDIAKEALKLVESGKVKVEIDETKSGVYAASRVTTECGTGQVVIQGAHTNVVLIKVDDREILKKDSQQSLSDNRVVNELKSMKISDIRKMVDGASEEELLFMLDGVEMNNKISDFGMEHDIGVGITRVMKEKRDSLFFSDDLMSRIMMKVISATEGRLDGCPYPSMSSSGAGTKGLVVIIPIAETAKSIGASVEQTVKTLAFGHLVNRYVNEHIGKLAATCTCSMAAATAASAAIAWLLGGDDEKIGFAIRNMVGTVTGMICDGGKVGCALKVSMAATAALTNAIIASEGVGLRVSDGICAMSPEQCIENMGRVGNPGMLQADKEILGIMTGNK